MFGSVNVANAATFNFSFDNEDGPVNGTVSGTIELPDGDFSNQPATSIVVNSAPALGFTLPLEVLNGAVSVFENTFTVVGGMIDAAVSGFDSEFVTDVIFGLNADFFSGASHLTDSSNPGNGTNNKGVLDSNSSTLTFTPANNATTPEPTSVITLIGVGVLGVASKLKKKA